MSSPVLGFLGRANPKRFRSHFRLIFAAGIKDENVEVAFFKGKNFIDGIDDYG